jgi:alpha-beta hydrolase superfamily lysophospholipase
VDVRRATTLVTLIVLLATAAGALLLARPQRVSFRTEDGVTIAATWYEPAYRPAPAVVLVHMLQRSRRDWDDVAARLAGAGIGALAIDLRGHGDSSVPAASGESPSYADMVQDIRAARRFLATRGDVSPSRIGIAGASLGANLAAIAAADGGFSSVALLSPSLDYRGLRIEAAVRKYGGRPLLLVSSDDDPYASRSALELQKTGASRELLTLVGAGHGTNMLSRAYELPQSLVDFFRRTLQLGP